MGASCTREALTANPDATSEPIEPGLSIAGWLDTESLSPFSASRDFTSVYGEVKVPLVAPSQGVPGIHELSVDLSGRTDNYSEVGHSAVPEGGLHYEPVDDQLSLRASLGRSFGAPELAQLFGSPISGPIPPFTYQGYYGNTASSAGFTGISGPNPSLQPFKANTWATGFDLTPHGVPGLIVSFNYFEANVKGAIGYLNQVSIVQSVESLGPASPFAQYVHVESPSGPGGHGSRPAQHGQPHHDLCAGSPDQPERPGGQGFRHLGRLFHPDSIFGRVSGLFFDGHRLEQLPGAGNPDRGLLPVRGDGLGRRQQQPGTIRAGAPTRRWVGSTAPTRPRSVTPLFLRWST